MTGSSSEEIVAALRRSRMFAELPDEDVAALARASRRVELEPGEVLLEEGSPPHWLGTGGASSSPART